MVHEVIPRVKSLMSTIDTTHVSGMWRNFKKIGMKESVPKMISLQRNSSNTPSQTHQELYKWMVTIPLPDSHIYQLEDCHDLSLHQPTV